MINNFFFICNLTMLLPHCWLFHPRWLVFFVHFFSSELTGKETPKHRYQAVSVAIAIKLGHAKPYRYRTYRIRIGCYCKLLLCMRQKPCWHFCLFNWKLNNIIGQTICLSTMLRVNTYDPSPCQSALGICKISRMLRGWSLWYPN